MPTEWWKHNVTDRTFPTNKRVWNEGLIFHHVICKRTNLCHFRIKSFDASSTAIELGKTEFNSQPILYNVSGAFFINHLTNVLFSLFSESVIKAGNSKLNITIETNWKVRTGDRRRLRLQNINNLEFLKCTLCSFIDWQ